MEHRGSDRSRELLKRLIGISTVLTYFNIAFCIALIGPTLLDLIQQTQVTWDRMGVLLMERAACTVVGASLAGCLANLNVAYLLLIQALSHVVVLVGQVFLPLCTSQTELIILFTIQGVCLGTNNNLSNLLTVVVQGQSGHAWMQGLFMAYSGAVLLAPVVSTPFLSEEAAKNQSSQSCSYNNKTVLAVRDDYTVRLFGPPNRSGIDLRPPYWISTVPCMIAIFMLLLSAVWAKCSKFTLPELVQRGTERELKKHVILLSFILAFFYFTLDGVTGRFIFSFAVKSRLCMTVRTAGLLTAMFGGATCLMRGTCAILAACRPNLVTPVRLLMANHVALSIALVTILLGRDSFIPAVWIFTFFSGIGVSNGFPSLVALLKSLGASKQVLTILPIGGAIGITIGPLITTYMMSDNVAGPGQGFYSLFAIATHTATLVFGSLMSSIDSVESGTRKGRQQHVSVSYMDGQEDVMVNEVLSGIIETSETINCSSQGRDNDNSNCTNRRDVVNCEANSGSC